MSAKSRKRAEEGVAQKRRKAKPPRRNQPVEQLETSIEDRGEEDKSEEFDISENNQYIDEQHKKIEQLARDILSTKNKKRSDRTKQEILDGLSEIFERISAEDALKVQAFAVAINVPVLPEVAPEYYKDRKNRSEKAPDFIRRVYKEYIGKGLSKPTIRQLDPKLYTALYDWLKTNDLPADMPIPNNWESTDEHLRHLEGMDDELLTLENLLRARRYRKNTL